MEERKLNFRESIQENSIWKPEVLKGNRRGKTENYRRNNRMPAKNTHLQTERAQWELISVLTKRSIHSHTVVKYHNTREGEHTKIFQKEVGHRQKIIKVPQTATSEPGREFKIVSKDKYLKPRILYPANEQCHAQVGKIFLRLAWSF